MTGNYRNSRQQRYDKYLLSPHWQSRRSDVLRRANGACEWCKEAVSVTAHARRAMVWTGDVRLVRDVLRRLRL